MNPKILEGCHLGFVLPSLLFFQYFEKNFQMKGDEDGTIF